MLSRNTNQLEKIMKTTHTPTPWHIGKWNSTVTIHATPTAPINRVAVPGNAQIWITGECAATNAAFIVLAVNSHESNLARIAELEATLQSALRYVDIHRAASGGDGDLCAMNCRAVLSKGE